MAVIGVAGTFTPREVAVLDRAIDNPRACMIVERQGAAVCAAADVARSRPRPSP